MTTQESAALMGDIEFRGRIKVCCVQYATSISSSPSTAIGHVGLENWAKQTFQSPDQVAGQVQPFVVLDPAVQTAGAAVLDPALQAAVEAVVNKTI